MITKCTPPFIKKTFLCYLSFILSPHFAQNMITMNDTVAGSSLNIFLFKK